MHVIILQMHFEILNIASDGVSNCKKIFKKYQLYEILILIHLISGLKKIP